VSLSSCCSGSNKKLLLETVKKFIFCDNVHIVLGLGECHVLELNIKDVNKKKSVVAVL
jgi:hypothetical protein